MQAALRAAGSLVFSQSFAVVAVLCIASPHRFWVWTTAFLAGKLVARLRLRR